jgi:pimeloyl-ACP methyl ester carboxylesterase
VRGILHVPASQAAYRHVGVVMLHGWGGYRIGPHRMFVSAARRLQDAGFHVLRFDFRGRGDSEGDAFDQGETESDAIPFLAADTSCAIQALRELSQVSIIVLLGICNGGEIATLAGRKEDNVDALVLWSTTTFLIDGAAEGGIRRFWSQLRIYANKLAYTSTWKKLCSGEVNWRGILATLFVRKRKIRPHRGSSFMQDIDEIEVPVSTKRPRLKLRDTNALLLIYGDRDPSRADSESYYRLQFRKRGLEPSLCVVPGADHNFSSMGATSFVIDYTVDWLKNRYARVHCSDSGRATANETVYRLRPIGRDGTTQCGRGGA